MAPVRNALVPALKRVRDAYRAMVPVKQVMAMIQSCSEWLTVDFQDTTIECVIEDRVCEKYPPPQSYTCKLLKAYLSAVECNHADVSDMLVATLLDCVSRDQSAAAATTLDTDTMHYLTCSVPGASTDVKAMGDDEITVTCRVASMYNEVGMTTWDAGWFLAEFVLAHRDWFRDRRILELGSGIGFTGLVMAKSVQAKSIVLSDYAPQVMQNLRYNLEINEPYLCSTEVATIDWETWPLDGFDVLQTEIMLAGDCVYDVDAFPSLMRVLAAFLHGHSCNQNQERDRVAYFAATIRNQSTFQTFLDHLEAEEVEYEDLTTAALEKMGSPIFYYENRDQIRLCRLTRKA